jgi:purine-nucleoside phosphorylase
MIDIYSNAQSAADYIRTASDVHPTIGIILGSGLGNFATQVGDPTCIAYAEIPHFPRSTVEGHSGNLVIGTIARRSPFPPAFSDSSAAKLSS